MENIGYEQLYQKFIAPQDFSAYPTPTVSYSKQSVPTKNPTFISDLIVSVILTVLGSLCGIISPILTFVANSYWKQGNFEAYKKTSKAIRISLLIGWILEGIFAIVLTLGFLDLGFQFITSGF